MYGVAAFRPLHLWAGKHYTTFGRIMQARSGLLGPAGWPRVQGQEGRLVAHAPIPSSQGKEGMGASAEQARAVR